MADPAIPSFLLKLGTSSCSPSIYPNQSALAVNGTQDIVASPTALSSASSDEAAFTSSDGIRIYVPPLNFAIVTPGVYRSGFPRPENFNYIDDLGLKSILSYLADQDFKEDTLHWAKKRGLQIYHVRAESIKEPLVQTSQTDMAEALKIALDTKNWPILVHCNRGRHRVGLLCALLRRLQGWSLTMLFDEYRRFFATPGVGGQESGNHTGRPGDYEWIESFDLSDFAKTPQDWSFDWQKRPA
ncbi:hypothetical protein EMMF5_004906 [Cystobasidiomycetes sp. EMM_F5]